MYIHFRRVCPATFGGICTLVCQAISESHNLLVYTLALILVDTHPVVDPTYKLLAYWRQDKPTPSLLYTYNLRWIDSILFVPEAEEANSVVNILFYFEDGDADNAEDRSDDFGKLESKGDYYYTGLLGLRYEDWDRYSLGSFKLEDRRHVIMDWMLISH